MTDFFHFFNANRNFYFLIGDLVKGFIDTVICRKCVLQGVWIELRSEVCFPRQWFTKYFEADLANQET